MSDAAQRFGAQALVIAIDAAREGDGWRVYVRSGREPTGLDSVEWARTAVELGAGEILLTSIDRDGTRAGFDIELLHRISDTTEAAVIACGGVGAIADLRDALTEGKADAVLAASISHLGEVSIAEDKEQLAHDGIPIRKVQV